MAVNLKISIKVRTSEKKIVGIALANAGFRSDAPEIIIPPIIAEKLGIMEKLIENGIIEQYEIAGGEYFSCYSLKNGVEIQVITEDRTAPPVIANCTMMRHEKEIIMSDKLISACKIVIEDAGEGIWRFRDENILRKSELPQYFT